MSLGLESGIVRVVAYEPVWPELFAAEAQRLHGVLGSALPLEIEHMGSTAVPGLAAKPVLDMMAGYPAGARVEPYIEALVRAGYVHRGEREIPGREFFRRGNPRAYHVHMVLRDGSFWRDHLAFRDALRAQPSIRDAYAALKLDLARRHPRDREAYGDGKTAFIRAVVAEALGAGQS